MFADKLSNPFLKPSPFLSHGYNSHPYTGSALPSSRLAGYSAFDLPKITSYGNISTSAYPSAEPAYTSKPRESVDLGQILSNNPFNRPTTGVFSTSRANQDLSPGKYSSNWNSSAQRPTSYTSSNAYSEYGKNYEVITPRESTYMNRQSHGRHTPQKKYDNYLSTSSADSTGTYINKIYEVEDDRSDGSSAAISNPFLRKNLLQEKPYEKEAKPINSYDSAALKYSYQSDQNRGYEQKAYPPTEDYSKYEKYEYKKENPTSKSYLPNNYETQYEPKYEQKYEPKYEKQYEPKYQTTVQPAYQSYANQYQSKPLSNPFEKKFESKKYEPLREPEPVAKSKPYAKVEVPIYKDNKYQKYSGEYEQNQKYGNYGTTKYGQTGLNGASGKYGEYKKYEEYGEKNEYKFSEDYEKFDFDEEKDYDRNWKEESKKKDSDPYDSYRVSFKPNDSYKDLQRDSQKNIYPEEKPDIYSKYHNQEDYAGAFQTLGGQKPKSKDQFNLPQSNSHLDRRQPNKFASSQVEQYEHSQPLQQKFAKRPPISSEYRQPPKPRSQNKIIKFDEEQQQYERPVKQRPSQKNSRDEYPRVLQIHGLVFHRVEIC